LERNGKDETKHAGGIEKKRKTTTRKERKEQSESEHTYLNEKKARCKLRPSSTQKTARNQTTEPRQPYKGTPKSKEQDAHKGEIDGRKRNRPKLKKAKGTHIILLYRKLLEDLIA
jgi:hypothetical protein